MPKPLYDHRHNQARARWAPVVDRGEADCAEAVCLMPTRWIEPGTPWDLAHNRATGEYRGPAHAKCNRAEGATHGNHKRTHRPWTSRPW